jgi:hypothetical protein
MWGNIAILHSNMQEENMEWDDDQLQSKFWPFVEKSESGCWEWTGPRDSDDYGRASYKGRRHQAHKLSYLIHRGEIDVGKIVARTCGNRLCVNPNHLVLRTSKENSEKLPNSYDYIILTEKGETVFRLVEREDNPVSKTLDEIRAMEILRGHANTSKSQAMRNAIAFYHAALKRGIVTEPE